MIESPLLSHRKSESSQPDDRVAPVSSPIHDAAYRLSSRSLSREFVAGFSEGSLEGVRGDSLMRYVREGREESVESLTCLAVVIFEASLLFGFEVRAGLVLECSGSDGSECLRGDDVGGR